MKVFVLITETTNICDYCDSSIDVQVFDTLEKAQDILVKTQGIDDFYEYNCKIYEKEVK